MHYAAAGKTEGLTPKDIVDPKMSEYVRSIQGSIVHYGETVSDLLAQMRLHGKGFAHAVYIQETSLIRFNEDRPKYTRLIGIYPEEGTFVADYHVFVLDAPWVTEEQRQAAELFGRWLADRIDDPRLAARYGFRVPGFEAEPPIDDEHGANPAPPHLRMLPPDGEVVFGAQEEWRENRKLASVLLAVDASASMGTDQKLERIREALPGCLEELVPQDRIGLITFDDHVRKRVSLEEWADVERHLRTVIKELLPDGPRRRLYDAIKSAFVDLSLLADIDSRINAIVVLTDGGDIGSRTGKEELLALLKGQEPVLIRVFTVAYGESADKETLRQIADASQGLFFEGDQEDIEKICRTVFFSF